MHYEGDKARTESLAMPEGVPASGRVRNFKVCGHVNIVSLVLMGEKLNLIKTFFFNSHTGTCVIWVRQRRFTGGEGRGGGGEVSGFFFLNRYNLIIIF